MFSYLCNLTSAEEPTQFQSNQTNNVQTRGLETLLYLMIGRFYQISKQALGVGRLFLYNFKVHPTLRIKDMARVVCVFLVK